jgi:hypothetical protein
VSARARTRRGDARGARRPQTPEPNETRDETAGDATWPQPLVVTPTRVAPARRAREDAGARGAAAAGPSAEVADIVAGDREPREGAEGHGATTRGEVCTSRGTERTAPRPLAGPALVRRALRRPRRRGRPSAHYARRLVCRPGLSKRASDRR